MRINTAENLRSFTKLWVVQRYLSAGWFDWSICTTLREAEEDYITAQKQDGHDRHVRIVRVNQSAKAK